MLRNSETKDDKNNYFAAEDQTSGKARILLALALTTTHDTKELRRSFQNADWRACDFAEFVGGGSPMGIGRSPRRGASRPQLGESNRLLPSAGRTFQAS